MCQGLETDQVSISTMNSARPCGPKRYAPTMTKTSVIVDKDIADQAAVILGTETLRDTIDASLHEVVNARRRLELIELLSDTTRFDFSSVNRAWGGSE
jgi:Arc/MetJ family transcription regulator